MYSSREISRSGSGGRASVTLSVAMSSLSSACLVRKIGFSAASTSEWELNIKKEANYYYYDLEQVKDCAELAGRLVVKFGRKFRQSYLLADRWSESISVSELKPERLTLSEFPGFKSVNLSKRELDGVIRQSILSWRGALSSVSGVYVISDTKSGKLYVGSAYGEGGIWGPAGRSIPLRGMGTMWSCECS